MEPKLILIQDEQGTNWLMNMDHIVAFAPAQNAKSTLVLFSDGKKMLSPRPLNSYFSQYPMPKNALILPGTAEIKDENAQPG